MFLINLKKLSTSLSLVPNVKKHWATLLHLVYPTLNKHAIVFIFFRIFIVTSSTTLPVSSPLLLRNPPNTFAFIPLPAMSLSSLNRSNSKTFRHIMPYSAPVCEGMHYHKTGVPWQMNKTLIINFSCSEMPCIALFCKGLSTFPGIVFSLLMTTLFAKHFKIVQFKAVCSSQIVVS